MINPTHFLEERNILSSYLKVVGRCDYLPYARHSMTTSIPSSGVRGNTAGKSVWIWAGQLDAPVILLLFLSVNYTLIHKFTNILHHYPLLCTKNVVIEVQYIQFIMLQTNEKFLHVFISLLSQKNHKSMLFNFKMFLI